MIRKEFMGELLLRCNIMLCYLPLLWLKIYVFASRLVYFYTKVPLHQLFHFIHTPITQKLHLKISKRIHDLLHHHLH